MSHTKPRLRGEQSCVPFWRLLFKSANSVPCCSRTDAPDASLAFRWPMFRFYRLPWFVGSCSPSPVFKVSNSAFSSSETPLWVLAFEEMEITGGHHRYWLPYQVWEKYFSGYCSLKNWEHSSKETAITKSQLKWLCLLFWKTAG